MNCPKCNEKVALDEKICPKCGAEIDKLLNKEMINSIIYLYWFLFLFKWLWCKLFLFYNTISVYYFSGVTVSKN